MQSRCVPLQKDQLNLMDTPCFSACPQRVWQGYGNLRGVSVPHRRLHWCLFPYTTEDFESRLRNIRTKAITSKTFMWLCVYTYTKRGLEGKFGRLQYNCQHMAKRFVDLTMMHACSHPNPAQNEQEEIEKPIQWRKDISQLQSRISASVWSIWTFSAPFYNNTS